MLSVTGLSGSDRDDKVSNRLDTSKEAVVSNKDVEKLGILSPKTTTTTTKLSQFSRENCHFYSRKNPRLTAWAC